MNRTRYSHQFSFQKEKILRGSHILSPERKYWIHKEEEMPPGITDQLILFFPSHDLSGPQCPSIEMERELHSIDGHGESSCNEASSRDSVRLRSRGNYQRALGHSPAGAARLCNGINALGSAYWPRLRIIGCRRWYRSLRRALAAVIDRNSGVRGMRCHNSNVDLNRGRLCNMGAG